MKKLLLLSTMVLALNTVNVQSSEREETILPDMSKESRFEMAERLNTLLANEYVLYTKTWKFHWNVEGKHFGSLHEFFGKQVEQLSHIIDQVAERVRALDIKAIWDIS